MRTTPTEAGAVAPALLEVLPGGVGRAEPAPWMLCVIPGHAAASVGRRRAGEGKGEEMRGSERREECVSGY